MQGLLSSLAFHTNLFSARSKPYGDGLVFRLHYRLTFSLLMGSCLLVTATQYIGAPISCLAEENLPPNVVNTYCYVASTFTLPSTEILTYGRAKGRSYRISSTYDSSNFNHGLEEKRYHNYYMWVPYVLFLQSISFYAPHWLWKVIQSDKVRSVLQGLNFIVMDEEQRRLKEALMVNYLVFHWGSHNYWALKYLLCEALNFANVALQFAVTDIFLGGQFTGYGSRVLQHLRARSAEGPGVVEGTNSGAIEARDSFQLDPMQQVFPRLTKCTFHKYGASGSLEQHDALCVLSINVINDKVYLTLWFWYIMLFIMNSLLLVYRLCTLFSPGLRARLLRSQGARHGADPAIEDVARFSSYGDWYLLRTLSRTMSAPVFASVIKQLATHLIMYDTASTEFHA